jgi:hypothetical protein
MGMSDFYGPADEDESIATIHAPLDAGVIVIDSGDFYGAGRTELLIAKALKDHDRDAVTLSVNGTRSPKPRYQGESAGRLGGLRRNAGTGVHQANRTQAQAGEVILSTGVYGCAAVLLRSCGARPLACGAWTSRWWSIFPSGNACRTTPFATTRTPRHTGPHRRAGPGDRGDGVGRGETCSVRPLRTAHDLHGGKTQ